jgi:hypothetical protein
MNAHSASARCIPSGMAGLSPRRVYFGWDLPHKVPKGEHVN